MSSEDDYKAWLTTLREEKSVLPSKDKLLSLIEALAVDVALLAAQNRDLLKRMETLAEMVVAPKKEVSAVASTEPVFVVPSEAPPKRKKKGQS